MTLIMYAIDNVHEGPGERRVAQTIQLPEATAVKAAGRP